MGSEAIVARLSAFIKVVMIFALVWAPLAVTLFLVPFSLSSDSYAVVHTTPGTPHFSIDYLRSAYKTGLFRSMFQDMWVLYAILGTGVGVVLGIAAVFDRAVTWRLAALVGSAAALAGVFLMHVKYYPARPHDLWTVTADDQVWFLWFACFAATIVCWLLSGGPRSHSTPGR